MTKRGRRKPRHVRNIAVDPWAGAARAFTALYARAAERRGKRVPPASESEGPRPPGD